MTSASQLAVDAHHLSKQFWIAGPKQRYGTLRDSLSQFAAAPLRGLRGFFKPRKSVWALDDVSFEVSQGEVVGVIGRNGAGKTTLLKILSRITEPTKGHADIQGRVGSLLEVGTGFHPELTGRDNIYLSGAILGMKRAEISRSFDQIVAFAEVERFVDTPIKRFSTGMFLRLAFAVAAHLETEILLVDEVLAVGDASFQKKCLGRLGDAAYQGRTVLFVSHNMGAVREICQRGIVLDRGCVVASGDISSCIESYYRSIEALGPTDNDSDGQSVFGPVRVDGQAGNSVRQAHSFEVCVPLRLHSQSHGFTLFCRLEDMQGRLIFLLREESDNLDIRDGSQGEHQISVKFPALWLNPGLYSLDFVVAFFGEYSSEEIVTSDKFPLDVEGRSSPVNSKLTSDPVLNPDVTWSASRNGPSRTSRLPTIQTAPRTPADD